MNLTIKPCPFCGGRADLITEPNEQRNPYHVTCMDQACMADGPWKGDVRTAAACWNRRFKVVTNRNSVRIKEVVV